MSERLWSPWRMEYVEKSAESSSGCIFCEKPSEERDEKNWIVHRGKTMFVILNAFPYNCGHLMVIPYRHLSDLRELEPEELLEWMTLAQRSVDALSRTYEPEGYNLGVNMGRSAGAGIAGHIHLHIVPRWNGDTNFMMATGDVKSLPESLDRTWARLKVAFDTTSAPE